MKRTIAARQRRRRGVTLLEVLISTFILAIGLLGLAALLPVGNVAIVAADKADRAAACAQAGLSTVKVRKLLYPANWSNPTPATNSFAIDPMGYRNSLGSLGTLERLDLYTNSVAWPNDMIDQIFVWHDDLAFQFPADVSLRPQDVGFTDKGHYTWFLTATPEGAPNALDGSYETYLVSVVVCYRRDLQTEEKRGAQIQGTGWGGGRIRFVDGAGAASPVEVKEDDWIMLYDAAGTMARWYRVVRTGGRSADPDLKGAEYVELTGPDCNDWGGTTQGALIIHDVVGVCTATVELDRFSIWNQ